MKKIFLLITAIILLTGCGSKESKTEEVPAEQQQQQAEQEVEQQLPEVSKDVVTDENFDQLAAPKAGETVANIKTSMGDIKIRFFEEDAPKTVENFVTLAAEGWYDGKIFHRVIPDFMIQGGSPEGDGMGGKSIYGDQYEDEFTPRLHNYRGALSSANSGPNTNSSQFFIVQNTSVDSGLMDFVKEIAAYDKAMYMDNRTQQIISGEQRFTAKAVENYETLGGCPSLDGGFPNQEGRLKGHTVFGQVYEGMDIVDAIANVATGEGDKPVEPVVINKIEILKY